MRLRTLQTRFILAGGLLVAVAIASGAWSAAAFMRLTAAVDATIRESQETIDLTAEVHGSLEREDDALLLFVSGDVVRAGVDLQSERRRGDERFDKLVVRLETGDTDERTLAAELRREIDEYRAAGDELRTLSDRPGALELYHRKVNPLLRRAAAGCDKLREANFLSMREAGIRARDEASSGARLVAWISVLGVIAAIAVAQSLARSILGPVRELTASVEAVRAGDFDKRVRLPATAELGRLAVGLNRMAEALAEYRRSSLGELLAAKRTLEATLNALPDAVLVFGADGALVATNPPADTLLWAKGVPAAARLADVPLSDREREELEAALAGRTAEAGPPDFRNALRVVVDGEPRRFLLTAVPIPDFDPGRFGAVAVFDDVTEFARLDGLRSELIGVASHELKSPLTSLRMNLLMLGEGAQDFSGRNRELLTAAIAGCEELALTIEELLDVTRVEAGQLKLHLEPVDLGSVMATVLKSMRTRFDDAGVRLVLVGGPEPCVVRGDAARLGSLFANVLGNALKYSHAAGAVTVRMSSGQNPQAGRADPPQIAVTDQGLGVPDEYRERIFEKFFRVEHVRPDRGEGVRGTGIGLYLCREIAKAHGGSIACETGDAGVGTRFVMTLPADT